MTRIREIITASPAELARELESINVDRGGIGIMAPKSFFHTLRIRDLKSPAANILKQETLTVGAECATSKDVILGDPEPQDVILMATRKQLDRLAKKLKAQPFGLKALAGDLEAFLKRAKSTRSRWETLDQLFSRGSASHPLIMGVINTTPDSFSDGGEYLDPAQATTHGMKLGEDGADILDIGGESTRPGSQRVSLDGELERVLPVIENIHRQSSILLSIDTMKSQVARTAIEKGVSLVNDISAGRSDPDIFDVVASHGCPLIMMHMLGEPETMQRDPHYDNVMDTLHHFFNERMKEAVQHGVREDQILLDPGIGFGKRLEDNYEILRRLRELKVFGRPLVVGASRKSFLDNERGHKPEDRYEETIAAHTVAMMHGADIIRVHDVNGAAKSRVVVQRMLGRA